MICCPTIIQSFVNESSSSIPYTNELQAVHGSTPAVSVLYRNDAGQYQGGGIMSAVTFVGGMININHGGNSTGIILIR